MAEPRADQTATLLPDGEVLVAGGYNGVERDGGIVPNPLTLAQLFDPGTRSWVQAAPMRVARDEAEAALLADGSVMVVGGTCPFLQYDPETGEWVCDSSNTAEIYDPSSNAWSPAPALSELRTVDTLTALHDGRVLLLGFFGPRSGEDAMGAAIYDPSANAWSAAAPPNIKRGGRATATLMNNGDVLLVGGSGGTAALDSAEEYDPSTNTWTVLAPMLQPRIDQAATLLPDGSVLVAGGVSGIEISGLVTPSEWLTSAETYDPATNTWQAIAAMNVPRYLQTATTLPNGSVLMVGGGSECTADGCIGYGLEPGDCCGVTSAEVYEPSFDRWTLTEPITSDIGHTATLLQNGEVLVAGGSGQPPGAERQLSSAYLYGPAPPGSSSQPTSAASPAAVPVLTLTHLHQSHRTWRERPAVRGVRAKRALPVGTAFAFVLSEPARIELTFTQLLSGTRLRGKCLARGARREEHACKRMALRGTLEVRAHAGTNKIVFRGFLPHRHRLPAGNYMVTAVASTATTRLAAQTLHFRIAR